MKKIHSYLASTLLGISLACSSFASGNIIVNTSNDASDTKMVSAALVGKQKFWGNGKEIVIAILQGDSEAEATLKDATGMDASRFKNHWQRLAFSGRGKMPKQFNDSEALTAFVKVNPGAIGICSSTFDASAVKKVN